MIYLKSEVAIVSMPLTQVKIKHWFNPIVISHKRKLFKRKYLWAAHPLCY